MYQMDRNSRAKPGTLPPGSLTDLCFPSSFCGNLGVSCVLSCAESDDEYSDDDDMSWKVRRSAVKCLEALISTRLDLLLSFYSTICPALLARFKEREENVRADVFAAFSTLLRQSRVGSSHPGLIAADAVRSGVREEEPVVTLLKKQVLALAFISWRSF